jgi:endonuclease/exonuclease/phosphatase family metal-dependent hydrolase
MLPGRLAGAGLSHLGKLRMPSRAPGDRLRQNDTLRVMTYNVWGIPTSSDRQARMLAIGRQLAAMNLDIVGLQECWLEDDRARVLAGLMGSDLSHSHFYPSGLMGSGLMLLSRFPIVDVGFHRYSLNGLPLKIPEVDYYGGKGIGYACLDTPHGEIAVFNTHIIARYAEGEDDLFRAHRAAQGYEFARYVDAQANGRPVIALGDFNVSPGVIGYQLVSVLGELSNCYEVVHGSESPVGGNIDHVFVRSGEDRGLMSVRADLAMSQPPEEIGLERLSDHDALLVELAPSVAGSGLRHPDEQRAEVLRELLHVLEQGIADATARARGHDVKAGVSLGAFVGAEVAGETLPTHRPFLRRALRYAGMLVALPLSITQAWQGRIVIQEEINTLSGLIEEVGVLLAQE